MTSTKTDQLGLRIMPAAKASVQKAAAREHRSVSNMVEHLILKYCEEHGITAEPARIEIPNQFKRGKKQ